MTTELTQTQLQENLAHLKQRITLLSHQAGRAEPWLLPVSKGHSAQAIRSLFELGISTFGESYVQEALAKQEQLTDLAIEWHFIGPLQSNKTATIAGYFDWVHSVDRLKIAQRLHDQRPTNQPPINICVQVNIDAEPQKSGIAPGDLGGLLHSLRSLHRLRLRGLMCVPKPQDDPAQQRQAFARLGQLFESWAPIMGSDWDTLSMGMSDDMEAAILEGTTLLRIGSALFGPRNN